MLKKITVLILAAMLFCFVSCDANSHEDNKPGKNTPTPENIISFYKDGKLFGTYEKTTETTIGNMNLKTFAGVDGENYLIWHKTTDSPTGEDIFFVDDDFWFKVGDTYCTASMSLEGVTKIDLISLN